jgi:hypothetical protein
VSHTSGETFSISSTSFDGCVSSTNGGALFLSFSSLSASVLDCRFLNCSAGSSYGGAIYFYGFDFGALRCLFHRCSADEGSACFLQNSFYSSSETSLTSLAEVLGDGNTGAYVIFELHGTPGFWARFERANITGNSVTSGLCALGIGNSRNVTFQLCDTRLNTGPSCFGFRNVANIAIRCLSVRSNDCTRSGGTTGLFYSESDVTISDSAIVENTVNYLTVGESSTVIFSRCHF